MKLDPKVTPREIMNLTINAMDLSIAEPREDGKLSPKVGALLLKPDGTTQTAYRGELRSGVHAEFTLIERKNRDSKLDGCVLFTTLEPCAPGARKHPKLSCAERIVNARISEVWVGIEDPDPTVDRKGIKFLQDAGVLVYMFDRDMQEIIRTSNAEFITQALQRAASHEEAPKEVKLSNLEDAVRNYRVDDLSSDALETFRSRSQIAEAIGSPEFNKRLLRLGLVREHGDEFVPTGSGLLMFGKEPRVSMPQAGLLATLHLEDGSEEVQNFDGPQVLVPELAEEWLRSKLPNPIDRSTARRQEKFKEFFTMAREAIVNALVHRDYTIAGAKCQLVVNRETIIVSSPGKPVSPITIEQLQSLDAPMLSRNPVLHYVFAQMNLAEERGLGLKTLRAAAVNTGVAPPEFSQIDPYIVLTLYRTPDSPLNSLPVDILNALTEPERTGWQWLTARGLTTANLYAEAMNVDPRTALRHLRRFVELGIARITGSGRSTAYEVV